MSLQVYTAKGYSIGISPSGACRAGTTRNQVFPADKLDVACDAHEIHLENGTANELSIIPQPLRPERAAATGCGGNALKYEIRKHRRT